MPGRRQGGDLTTVIMRFRWWRGIATIRRTRPILATTGSIGAIAVTPAWAGAESVVAITSIRAIGIGTAFETNETVLLRIATDQSIATIELRGTHIPTSDDKHRIAGAIQFDPGRSTPAFDARFAFTAIDRIVSIAIATLDLVSTSAFAANLTLAAVVVPATFGTIPVDTGAPSAIVITAAFVLADATAADTVPAITIVAAFGAAPTVGFLVIATTETIATRTIQMVRGSEKFTPIALHPTATFAFGSAPFAMTADFAPIAFVAAVTGVATLAVTAILIAAAMRAITAIDQFGGGQIDHRAAAFVSIANVFAPAIVATFARTTLIIRAAFDTMRIIATSSSQFTFIGGANRRFAIGLIETGQTISAIAGSARTPVPTIAVIAALRTGDIVLAIDTAFEILFRAEFAIDDHLALRIVATAFSTDEAAVAFVDAAGQPQIIANIVAIPVLPTCLAGFAFSVTATGTRGYAIHPAATPFRIAANCVACNLASGVIAIQRRLHRWIVRCWQICRWVGGRWIGRWWIWRWVGGQWIGRWWIGRWRIRHRWIGYWRISYWWIGCWRIGRWWVGRWWIGCRWVRYRRLLVFRPGSVGTPQRETANQTTEQPFQYPAT